jgi:hypothetical protein
MSKVSYRALLLRPLLVTAALPFGLLAEGAAPTYAGVVTVTGANGANGANGYYVFGQPGGPGGAATADAGHLIRNSDPSNTATATGGNGGQGGSTNFTCSVFCSHLTGGPGGPGGPAMATATTLISTGSATATATATSTGGAGGNGGRRLVYGHSGGNGGNGGAASSSANASNTNGSASATATSTGGNGGPGGLGVFAPRGSAGAGGAAKAFATGVAITGNVQASASAVGGAGATPGTAFAQSLAKNASGEALTIASAPGGGAVSAVSNFAVGSGPERPAAIMAGWVVSDAKRTPGGSVIGYGAMSAGSGESGAATALFDFSTTVPEALDLNLLSDSFLGSADTVELKVVVGGKTTTYDFSNLTFPKQLQLGAIPAGSQTVSLSFDLKGGNGFGFTYDFADPHAPSAATIPEPSTWAMMLIGFAGLACAGYRASRRSAAIAA